MIYGSWAPSASLRFVEREVMLPEDGHVQRGRVVRILQQRWTRSTVEYTEIAGRPRKYEGFEEEWRDVPLEKEG